MKAIIEYPERSNILISFETKPSLKVFSKNYEWLPIEVSFDQIEDEQDLFAFQPKNIKLQRILDDGTIFESWQLFKIFDISKKDQQVVISFEGCSLLN